MQIDPAGLSGDELAELERLLAQLPSPPTVQAIWRLMDAAWAELGCDELRPDPARLGAFYRHPVWALNGMFVEQDPESRGHREAIVAWCRSALAAEPSTLSGRILDYGGGYGSLARMVAAALPAWRVEVYEPYPSAAALARAAALPNLHYVADLGAGYSSVLCLDVLEHLIDPLPELARMAGALAPGGRLVIANHFYPAIRCHLPGTFHLRYSFPLIARLAGLAWAGRCPGSPATIYRRVGRRAPNLAALRRAEQLSRALYPALWGAHRVYRRLRRSL